MLSDNMIKKSEQVRGKGVGFDRLRRITGYLVGSLDRFNSGKRAEEHDRVKHIVEIGGEKNEQVGKVLERA